MKTIHLITITLFFEAIAACKQDNGVTVVPTLSKPSAIQTEKAADAGVEPEINPLAVPPNSPFAMSFMKQNVLLRTWSRCDNDGATSRKTDLLFLKDGVFHEFLQSFSEVDCPVSKKTGRIHYLGAYFLTPSSAEGIWDIELNDNAGYFSRFYTRLSSDGVKLSFAGRTSKKPGDAETTRAEFFANADVFTVSNSFSETTPPCPTTLGQSPELSAGVDIFFLNTSTQAVELSLLDGTGKEVPFDKVQAGEVKNFSTFDKQIWVVRDESAACKSAFAATSGFILY